MRIPKRSSLRYPPGRVALGVALVVMVACEVPQAPEWEIEARVPFTADPVSIVDFLPDQVDTATVQGIPAFTVERQEDSASYTLATTCPDCRFRHGTISFIPSFQYSDSFDVLFPEKLVSIEVVESQLSLSIRNNFNFDPLRPDPDPASAGSITVVARDLATGALLDSVLVSGANETFPGGTSKQFVLDLSGVTITDGIRTVTHIDSPQDGQTVTVDTTLTVGVETVLDGIAVAGATAVVEDDTLEENVAVEFDADLRNEISEDVRGGSFMLELTHNLDLEGGLEVSIAGSAADLFSGSPTREVRLLDFDFGFAPDGRTATREITQEETRFIADLPQVVVGLRATARGRGRDPIGRPTARLTPDQVIETKFEVTARVRVGDFEEGA